MGGPSFFASFSTVQTILILGGVAAGGIALALAAFRLRTRWMLAGAFVLATLQFFGPFGFTSFGLLAICALLPAVLWRFWRENAGIWGWLLAGLGVWQAISVLWSEKLGSAAYGVVVTSAALVSYLLARNLASWDRSGLSWAIAAASPVVIGQALLTILFRLVPDLNYTYLVSPIAPLFTEPGVEEVANGAWPNVMDPDKAGGLFINGNAASLFFAVAACLFIWAAMSRRLVPLHVAGAVVSLIAMFATGSKTPLLLAIVVPLAAAFIVLVVRRTGLALLVAAVGAAVGAAGLVAVSYLRPGILAEAQRTIGERAGLWQMVADAFPDRWFTGFGFGYWRLWVVDVWDDYFTHTDPQVWPPHNLFLQAWVDAGLVALLLTVALVAIPLIASIRRIVALRAEPAFSARSVRSAVVFAGLAWVLLHGMADTTTFVGDNHTIPFVAILVTLAVGRAEAPRLDPAR